MTTKPWFRHTFRRGRRLLLVFVLLATVFLYLNQVGLPAFAKARIEDALRTRGIELQFDRLRLRGFRTLIAENVRWRNASSSNGPDLAVKRVELRLHAPALWRGQVQVEAVLVRHGDLIIPFVSSYRPPARLPLEDVNLELRFLPNAQWDLARFRARCKNADVQASGTITNALALREQPPAAAEGKTKSEWPDRLHELAAEFERLSLSPSSELHVKFQGDGRDASTFHATLDFQTAKVSAPWGTLEDLRLNADTAPSDGASQKLEVKANLKISAGRTSIGEFVKAACAGQFTLPVTNLNLSQGHWQFQVQNPQTSWGSAGQLILSGKAAPLSESTNQSRIELRLEGRALRSSWVKADSSTLTAELVRPARQPRSLEGSWRLDLTRIESKWGDSDAGHLSGHLLRLPMADGQKQADAAWGWWRRLEPIYLDWQGQMSRVSSPTLQIDQLDTAGEWRAPELVVRKLHAQLYDGQFDLNAALGVRNREVRSQVAFDFDLQRIAPLFATNTQRWLQQFRWEVPPRVAAEVRLILPAWTNREPDAFRPGLKTLGLSGTIQTGHGAYRGMTVSSAQSHFSFTNAVWHFPDLIVSRPEGQAVLDGRADVATGDYRCAIHSEVDPKALKPLLEPAAQRVLDYFKFTQPPVVQGQAWGQWQTPDRVGISAEVAMTNFAFRGETLDDFQAALQYTNRFFSFSDVRIRRGQEQITATKAGYDVQASVVHLTNGVSTMDPDVVTRVISSNVREAISPYHFKEPPMVLVNGRLPTRSEADADATFKIAGPSFDYWKFHVPQISGDVYWRGETVTISNLQANFYKGKLAWEGKFDFSGPPGARFQFRGHVAQTDLRSLVADLTSTNTSLEGILDGNLTITSADTRDLRTWQGFGDVQLHDGFLWNVPIFGFFSPILNKIVPGLGQSRVSAGSATFGLDQGRIRTSDLEMKSPALRLQYVGSVDFKGQVDTRVQAEVLRDAWAVGRAVSLALWPLTKAFEYKVTGTLNEPKSELLYFPKFLMWPFHPFRTLKEIFPLGEPAPPLPPQPKTKSR